MFSTVNDGNTRNSQRAFPFRFRPYRSLFTKSDFRSASGPIANFSFFFFLAKGQKVKADSFRKLLACMCMQIATICLPSACLSSCARSWVIDGDSLRIPFQTACRVQFETVSTRHFEPTVRFNETFKCGILVSSTSRVYVELFVILLRQLTNLLNNDML